MPDSAAATHRRARAPRPWSTRPAPRAAREELPAREKAHTGEGDATAPRDPYGRGEAWEGRPR
ncbi:hypothetical protein AB0D38_05290, partial [Streptomyces sp. NPDC048279]|uniref:hypothetical protein n=1 Tax=Streptomyces sp. NPDC048279 TaxID=3154714 RepID=UPI003415C820